MPKCRNCGRDIPLLDRDMCPYCGAKNPLVDFSTMDMTGHIDTLKGEYKLYRTKSRLLAFFLALFLGIFGADHFYRGYSKRGIVVLSVTIVLIGGAGSLLYFLAGSLGAWGYLIPFLADFAVNAALGIRYLVNPQTKDSRGEFMR